MMLTKRIAFAEKGFPITQESLQYLDYWIHEWTPNDEILQSTPEAANNYPFWLSYIKNMLINRGKLHLDVGGAKGSPLLRINYLQKGNHDFYLNCDQAVLPDCKKSLFNRALVHSFTKLEDISFRVDSLSFNCTLHHFSNVAKLLHSCSWEDNEMVSQLQTIFNVYQQILKNNGNLFVYDYGIRERITPFYDAYNEKVEICSLFNGNIQDFHNYHRQLKLWHYIDALEQSGFLIMHYDKNEKFFWIQAQLVTK